MWLFLACSGDEPSEGVETPADSGPEDETDSGPEDETDSGDTADTGDALVFDTTVDVIVVGSGPAGAAATVTAMDAGATVIVFEREEEAGMGMRLAGMAYGVDTRWQAAEGVTDSVEAAIAEWPEITGANASEGVEAFITNSGANLEWLEAKGAEIIGPIEDLDVGSVARLHQMGWDEDPWPTFTEGYEPELRLGVEVTEPVMADGVVVGVRWRDTVTGEEGATGAGAVVIATGGFLRNRDRVDAAVPALADRDLLYETNPSSNGGGLPFLDLAGAGSLRMEDIGMYVHAIQDPAEAEGEALVAFMPDGMVLVDSTGNRFIDEEWIRSFDLFDQLPSGDVFGITSGPNAGYLAFMRPAYNWVVLDEPEFVTLTEVQDLGSTDVFMGADPEELAALAGFDPGAFVATLDAFNTAVYTGTADAFGRELEPGDALDGAPFVALRLTPGLAKAFGGVATDASGHVLTPMGEAIPGLYAAGEVTGMVLGGGGGDGFSGSGNACYWSGRVAGGNAAASALGE
ncbi:MAG: FAD-binding protein [Deltaproteobacteria bacterium]|nr:FAD-binding protein [Deltaproteobacteria bacterium]